ncbi:ANR family transcriptional regulator [Providencia rettgeri]|uniref:ANR family transcriptional regulator n=1 Tax=Providencia rettgeri TaxID=587 RepID=A0AAP2K1Y8_PRORE|nr:ANR family transcriptional regulator [Providencia rettgeri]MBX6949717.1 ANR family transcriptional regulator [Providencia rettgeri]MBX6958022.1 ANR family transcriptional regulator [Providencia rettgeri]MBX6962560.1 ANR family transcriptional regulator [Providencia rettgeri]MBX6974679.1 ANR family transcriptional regulator [Providencia rettgeri]MBX6982875.1 ANR family transcriptional regulator [Providencia rettgeri]
MARLTFIYCATMASQAERNGHYSQAHAHWIDASRLARKSENRVWAELRAEFYLKAPIFIKDSEIKNDTTN